MRWLLTGGSSCGKSTYAEALAASLPGPRYYVATMLRADEECEARIRRHRAMRAGKGFETIERHVDVAGAAFPKGGTVLLECVCTLAANEMFDPAGAGGEAEQAVLAGVDRLESLCDNLIVVTNDVGSGGGDYDASVLEYVDMVGRVNNTLASRFENVYELCCGIPLVMKGAL